MADPDKIREIQEAVTIPVMAKCRIGHFAEAQILEALEVDYIDESEVLDACRQAHHVDKWGFTVPFVCGCTRPRRGAAAGRRGRSDDPHQGRGRHRRHRQRGPHMRSVFGRIRRLGALREEELYAEAKELRAPYELVKWVAENGKLPVVTFTAGGIATPADAALCMQLGADGVFVGSGIYKSARSVPACEGDRRGDDPLPRSRDPRPRLGRPGRPDERARGRRHPGRRAPRDPRLVTPFGREDARPCASDLYRSVGAASAACRGTGSIRCPPSHTNRAGAPGPRGRFRHPHG